MIGRELAGSYTEVSFHLSWIWNSCHWSSLHYIFVMQSFGATETIKRLAALGDETMWLSGLPGFKFWTSGRWGRCVEPIWRGDDGDVNGHCFMFSSFRKMLNHRSMWKTHIKATSTVMQHLDLLALYILTKYAIIRIPFQGACFGATAPIIQATFIWSTWRASSLLRCFLKVQSDVF